MAILKVGDVLRHVGTGKHYTLAGRCNPTTGFTVFFMDDCGLLYLPFEVQDRHNISEKEFGTHYKPNEFVFLNGDALFDETYKVGQRFKIDGGFSEDYMICRISPDVCILINMENGNRYTDPVNVKNDNRITKEEMSTLCHNAGFKLVE